ncbi:hypothetical protein DRJ25_04435 [Candidatus Woesearchaeota archaeon]|nr:MAG: hypothetical protein DRJ25_04435 [Candidatus Woesearchaeota archaeon]
MSYKELEIKSTSLTPINKGRSYPFRWENYIIKLETMPNWEGFERPTKTIDIQNEYNAVLIAKSLGVYTPEIELIKVTLVNNGQRHTTRATIREWQELQTYNSSTQLFISIPKICHRIDFQYILIVDFLLANYDRRYSNILYDKVKDVVVPIDYDSSFAFDAMPCNIDGVKILFSKFISDPVASGMLDFDILIFGEVYAWIKKQINFSLLAYIDDRLVKRAVLAEDAFRQYFLSIKGDINVGNIRHKHKKSSVMFN